MNFRQSPAVLRFVRSKSHRIVRFLVLASLPFAAIGCAGLTNALDGTTSYQGTWTGTVTGNGQTGSMNITVDSNNNVSGTDTISKPGYTTQDTGSISGTGALTLTTAYAGTAVGSITAQVSSSGTQLTTTSGTITVGTSSTGFSMTLSPTTVLIKKQ